MTEQQAEPCRICKGRGVYSLIEDYGYETVRETYYCPICRPEMQDVYLPDVVIGTCYPTEWADHSHFDSQREEYD